MKSVRNEQGLQGVLPNTNTLEQFICQYLKNKLNWIGVMSNSV